MTVEQAREVLSEEIEGIEAVRDRLGEEFERAVIASGGQVHWAQTT